MSMIASELAASERDSDAARSVRAWCDASGGAVADTVRTFREKAVAAFRHNAPHGGGTAAADARAAPASLATPRETGAEAGRAQPPAGGDCKWWQAERRGAPLLPTLHPAAGTAAKRSGCPAVELEAPRASKKKSKALRGQERTSDWDTGESDEEMRKRGLK